MSSTLIRRLPLLARSFHTSPASCSTHPSDVVAHKTAGPVTVHNSPEAITADVISDAPQELRYRQVRIYQPTKSTMQSGKAKTSWKIDWDTLQGAGRWENPLMGWAATADYMQGTSLAFKTKEDAIHFAEKQGWDYQLQQPNVPKIPPKNYANNYVHVPGKLRIHHTK
ncbi:NADH dehydrogenase (ubiquinone) Fe-S protein 4, partial [Tremellales sp. Uapishka_1]